VLTGDRCNEELVPLFAEQDADVYFKDALTTMNYSTISHEQFRERLKVNLDKIYEDIDKYCDSLAEVASDNSLFAMIEQNNLLFGAGLMSLLCVSAALNDNFNNCIVTNIANSAIVAQGRLGGWKQILWMHENKFVFLGAHDMLYTHVDGVNSQLLPLVDGVPEEALKSFCFKPSEIKCVGNTLVAVTTPNTRGPFRSIVLKFNLVPLKEGGSPVSEELYTFYQNESTVSMDCSEKLLSIHSTINTSRTLHTIFLSSPKNTIASIDLLSFLQSNLELHKLALSQDNDISKGDVYVFDTVAIVVFKLCKGDLASSSADWHLALKPLPGQPPTLLSVIKDIPKKDLQYQRWFLPGSYPVHLSICSNLSYSMLAFIRGTLIRLSSSSSPSVLSRHKTSLEQSPSVQSVKLAVDSVGHLSFQSECMDEDGQRSFLFSPVRIAID